MGYKKYSKEQEMQIVEEYKQGIPVEQLKEKYGYKTRKSITDKVKKYCSQEEFEQIKNNRNIIKKGYEYKLEKIQNEFDAYFIGLLLTDGYIIKDRNQVGIDLIDEDCISYLSKSIGKKYNKYKGRENEQEKFRLVLSDKDLIQNIKRFGVIENKTDIIPAPQLLSEEEKFIPYLIRGIIDGDGNIDIRNNCVGFRIATKSKEFAEWIRYVLENKMFMQDISINNNSNIYIIETYQIQNFLKLFALSYSKPFGMMRKYIKIGETFRDYNNPFLK